LAPNATAESLTTAKKEKSYKILYIKVQLPESVLSRKRSVLLFLFFAEKKLRQEWLLPEKMWTYNFLWNNNKNDLANPS